MTICSVAKCPTPARRDGLCARHGGGLRCNTEGCKRYPRTGGFCTRHGGKIAQREVSEDSRARCYVPGCISLARKNRLCFSHLNNPLWGDQMYYKLTNREKKRYLADNKYQKELLLRAKLYQSIARGNSDSAMQKLVACSLEELLQHLQAQFDDKMHWGNFGDWHIDHIKPCASFNLCIPNQQTKCFHYTNLYPKWGSDSLSKGMQLDW